MHGYRFYFIRDPGAVCTGDGYFFPYKGPRTVHSVQSGLKNLKAVCTKRARCKNQVIKELRYIRIIKLY